MGCSQGKTTKPTAAGASATSAEPMPTILRPSSAQKQATEAEYAKMQARFFWALAIGSKENGTEPKEVEESVATVQAVSKDWPLRSKALRMFAMADKGPGGLLDAKELAGDGSDKAFSEMLQGVLHGDVESLRSQAEWLESVKQLVLRDEVQAFLFLDLCEMHLIEQKEQWPLRDEALQVFAMGDRNGGAQLDMNELTEIRQSDEFAQAMMDTVDMDKSGMVSKGEWLAYVKRLADNNQQSAASVLALYRQHLSNSSNTAEAYVAAKNAMDVLVDDSAARSPQCWWACY